MSPARRASASVTPANAPVTGEELPLGALGGMLARTIADRTYHYLAEAGVEYVRPAGVFVLSSLSAGPASVTELAERCDVTKQAISRILVGLEDQNLVRSVPDPRDGRMKVVQLTTKGRRIFDATLLASLRVEDEWRAVIGDTRMNEVRDAMLAYIVAQGNWEPGETPRLRPTW
ncbi:MAG TPA: MarR family transcriptional regulator [Acidimicrobiia bacterium]|nr:MarR family transcriptional regulator [Acidimicrobiia bacterium]